MTLIITAFLVLGGLELMVWLPPVWRWRKPLAGGLSVMLAVFSAGLVIKEPRVWAAILASLSLYRLLNLRRLIVSRVQADYLYRASRRTALWLMAWQIADLALAGVGRHYHVGALAWLYLLAAAQLAVAAVLLASTIRNLRTAGPPKPTNHYTDRDLPDLTVALPARNETDDLEACLETLVRSNYPKLEILVLDDCSQNKRTPEIIRSFAHAGIRFIAGQAPPDHWLAKNYAYQQLADAANGELLLFCGVDTRFEVDSLRQLVEIMLQKKKTMLSVLPRNNLPDQRGLWPLLVQPGRYAWELGLPRQLAGRPPVLSTCWLVTSKALHAGGGFKAVSRGHSPESYFARAASRQADGYSFLCSNQALGLASRKSLAEERSTAIRTRYPQLHRRPELVGLLSLAELAVLVGPLALAVGSLAGRAWLLLALSSAAGLLLVIFYAKTVQLTYRHFLWPSLWLLPLAAVYDIGLLNYSMWQYEFRQVIWKGRNICIPVMRITPVSN